ncbi:cysteine proteinase [Coniophora puteana RWD-64-598 SS2]|uniref:Ubiquitin carboxyl-terminal hydrolase n=1 Tax=Coniophora puteana (strain RWD-64-598) TaxID=741705 RepID=A0A5M3MBL2_CONPW|nr:cysteine proteinase [Coniophora puteana RWD-64-598 SS2]EIW76622.1 cysteine proteinase [Coniophora puteana RWD-64-598 SS2]
MAPLDVHIKHAGKVFDLQLDPDQPPTVFKDAVYHLTGVPPERMKVMVKGGMLKDDSDWKKIGPKADQTFMVIGAAGELPKPPPKPIVFLEDMDDAEMAEALALPVGLKNLGNTCYMNSVVQAMRAIPELQQALSVAPTLDVLPRAMRDLYSSMGRTTDAFIPNSFLSVLRQVVPQFNEFDRSKVSMMASYAQQDAEECWTQIANNLKIVPGLEPDGASASGKKFIDQFMMGEVRRELKCNEAPEEEPTVTFEKVLKIECNISGTTNYMQTGIMDALNQEVEKNSPSLGRSAVYTQTTRLSRLPGYLTVHMVRFAWRRDVGKKAKIMRKVKFAEELDGLDVATDELRAKLLPASRRLKEMEKERAERRKVRKRTRVAQDGGAGAAGRAVQRDGDVEMANAAAGPVSASTSVGDSAPPHGTGGAGEEKGKGRVEDVDLEPEHVYRTRELKELEELVHPDVKSDYGASLTGLYELVAIVTHKGPQADSGHYMGFVKKSVFHTKADAAAVAAGETSTSEEGAEGAGSGIAGPTTGGQGPAFDDDDEDWYKFDDEKVSVFPKEKLGTIDGGGEDSSAYVLLYKSKSLV